MKRNWQPEELVEHWTLLPPELDRIDQRTDSNRLGFALLLKFFQYADRFPNQPSEIPKDVEYSIFGEKERPPVPPILRSLGLGIKI